MKHILNDLTEQEKNNIREQHKDTIKVSTEKFIQLLESKLGDVKPLVIEQNRTPIKPEGQTIKLIQIKVGDLLVDLKNMVKKGTGSLFFGNVRGENGRAIKLYYACGNDFVNVQFGYNESTYTKDPISPAASKLLSNVAGCNSYVKNQVPSSSDMV